MQIIITIANPSNYKIPVSIYLEFYTSVYYLVHLREPLPYLMARMYSICYTRLGINLQFYMYSYNISFTCAFITYNTQYCSNLQGWYYFSQDLLVTGPTSSCERSSVPNPDLLQHEHLRILYCMHLCVNTDMHDLMHTCDVYMNQKVKLIVIHGTLFLIAARKSC